MITCDVPSENIDIVRDGNTAHAHLGIDRIDRHGTHRDQQIAMAGHRGLAFDINQTVVGRKRRGFTEGDGFHSEIRISAYTLIYSQIFIIIFSVPVPHAVNQCIWATAY